MNQKLKMEKFNSSAALLESWSKLLLSNLQEDLPHVRRIPEGARGRQQKSPGDRRFSSTGFHWL